MGLRFPVSIAHAPGDSTRLFVVERTGTIRIFRAGALLPTPFVTVSGVVSGFNEQGLLDVAFDPNYATTGHFYVFVIRSGSGGFNSFQTAIVRYTVSSADPDVADPNSATPLFTLSRDALNHNGGKLAFGPDGCLYAGLGDGGGSNDQHGPIGNGQDTTQQLGKLLRLDVDNYPTPAPGNLSGENVNPHIWDYGLRNPWRFSFDRATGDLYIADVGQNTWEEVNVEAAGTGKLNYGWRPMEGMHCRGETGDGGGCDRTGMTLPVAEYRNPDDGVAIVGGYVYRGTAIPGLQGRYFYADYSSDRIWTFTWDGNAACDQYEVTNQLSLAGATSFGEDSAGELYVVTHGSGQNGRLYRIDAD